METGSLGEELNPWAVELFRTIRTVEPQTATEQSAYDTWLDQTSAREQARTDRIHGAVGVIPAPLWVQALLVGTVVSVLTAMLLVLDFLNDPFHDGFGGLQPVAIARTLEVLEQERAMAGQDAPIHPPRYAQRVDPMHVSNANRASRRIPRTG